MLLPLMIVRREEKEENTAARNASTWLFLPALHDATTSAFPRTSIHRELLTQAKDKSTLLIREQRHARKLWLVLGPALGHGASNCRV